MADPAFGTLARTAALAGVVAAWSVVTVVQIFSSVLLQPVQVDQPPACHEMRTVEGQAVVASQWTLTWDAQRRPNLPGSITAVQVDNPPIQRAQSIPTLLDTWQATLSWPAQTTRKLAQGLQVNNPPFTVYGRALDTSCEILLLSTAPTWDAQARPKLVQPGVVAVVNNPPIQRAQSLPTVLDAWASGQTWALPQRRPNLPGSILAVQVDQPIGRPFAQQAVFAAHYAHPGFRTLVVSGLAQGVQVDQPPIQRAQSLSVILDAWQATLTWPAQTTRKLAQGFVVVQVDNPPYQHAGRQAQVVLALWSPQPLWDAQARAKLTADTTGVLVNEPPYTAPSRSAQQLLIAQNPPLTWDAQVTRKLVQGAAGAQVDNPPIQRAQSLPALLDAWQPVWPWGVQPGLKIAPNVVVVAAANAPPVLHPARAVDMQALVIESWTPGWPVVVRPVRVTAGGTTYNDILSLAAVGDLSFPIVTLSMAPALSLSASGSVVDAGPLTMAASEALSASALFAPTGPLVMATLATVAAQATLLDSGGFALSASLALGSAAQLALVQTPGYNVVLSMAASAGLSQSAVLALATSMALGAKADLTDSATTQLATAVALQVQSVIVAQAQQIQTNLVALGVKAQQAQATTALFAHALALSVSANLLSSGLTSPTVGRVLMASGDILKQAVVSGELLTQALSSGETLT